MEADVARESMCKTCGRIFSTSQEMQSHAVAHTGIRPFVCGLCGYSYTRRPALTTHMLHHQGKGFRCRHCCMKFAVKSLRDVHEQTHTGERPHTCHICDNRYSNEKSLKIHVSMKHKSLRKNIQGSSKSDSGQCQLCGMVFQNGRLQQHLQKKHPETVCCKNIPCKYCSEKFFNSKQLKRHISVCHSDHRQLYGACMEENSGKIDYSSYVISDANISSSKQLICALCNQKFLRMKDIHSHLRRVHRSDTDKEFFCSICNRGFSLAREMQVHMRSHTNSRPYICRVCGKTYKQVGHVRQHLLSHSNSCISCRICGKLFKTDVCLSYHVRNHNRLHPYKCPICAESFKEIAKLLSHCSQYSDQDQNKTYTCHMCLKAFESAVIVCKHLVSHKADCPYVCEKCPESFSQYSQLYKHKVDADHFTENEIISSTISNNRVLTSCNSVDMDMHELIKQYDYVPADNMELDPALLRGEKQRKKSKNPRQQKPKTSPEDSAPVVEPIVTVKYEADMEDKSSQEEILIAVAQQLTDMGEAGEPGHIDTFTDTTDQTNILVTHAFTTNSEFVNPVSHEINVEQCVVWDTEVVTSAGDLECHEFDTDLQPSTSCDNASVELGNLTSSLIYKAKQQDCSEPVTCMDSDTVTMTYPDNTADSSSVLRPTHKVIDASGNELFVCFVNENNTPDDDIDEETINKLFQNEDFFVQSAQNLIIADDHREDVVEDAVVSTCDPDLSNHVNMKVPYSVENNSMEVHEDGVFVNDSAIVAGDIEANKTDINVEQLNGMNYKINGRYYNREQTKLTHPFQCPECPKRFKLPSALTLHSSCHLQDADCKHKCGFCGKGFSTPSRLKLHENIHLGLRPYKCKQCPKSFRQPGHLMTHLRIHANYRPFQCSMCSVSYTSQAHLNQHLQRHKFLDQRTQHKCRICHKVYVLKKSLDQHYLTVHGETNELNQELTDSNQPDIQGEKYRENLGSRMCDMCGKSYNTTRDFENHLLTHNGQAENDEMVKCARCSKLFASPELLIQHMQCHAKANYKYQCEICGQSLSSKQGVLRHIQRCHGKI